MPWAPIDYPVAVELMKAALDQGANFWNGVRESYARQAGRASVC